MGSCLSFLGGDSKKTTASKYATSNPAEGGSASNPNFILGETENVKHLYTFGKVLGKGQFGVTKLVTAKSSGKKYACKVIDKTKIKPKHWNEIRREIQILHHLSGHKNVVTMEASYEDSKNVYVVMELCTGGELFDRIVDRGYYTEKDAAAVFRTMVRVVDHCHQMGVIHRDLKPENFLFSDPSPTSEMKAIDFGLSSFFKEGQHFSEIVGSAYYVAPEVLRKKYGKEADIWSLGVVLYILLCGVPPFFGDNEQNIFEQVLTGTPDFSNPPWPSISKPAIDVVRRMLVRDPAKRASPKDILNHPWVKPDGVAAEVPIQSEVILRLTQFATMNKFKKVAIKYLAIHLPEDEVQGLRQLFQAIDADNSGSISFEELRDAMIKKGIKVKEQELEHLMSEADANGDGMIDYEEFLAATVQMNKLTEDELLAQAFKHFDKDNSGFITRDELVEAMADYGEDGNVDEIIASVDQNSDGQIDFNEFKAMMRNTGVVNKMTKASVSGT